MESEVEFVQGLYKKTIKELRQFGRSVGVYAPATLSKADLIAHIRAIVYGTELPKETKMGRPVKGHAFAEFQHKQQAVFDEIEKMYYDSKKPDMMQLNAASPIVPFDDDVDKEIAGMDFTGIDKDDVAVCHINKKEQFIFDAKTMKKYPLSLADIEKYQLTDGDFVYGIGTQLSEDLYSFDIKWINGYWIDKKMMEHEYVSDQYFNLPDNYGYARLVSLFAPVVRGEASLLTAMDEDTENQMICEVLADLKVKYNTTLIKSITFGLDIATANQMDTLVGGGQFHVKNRYYEGVFEDITRYMAGAMEYYKADGEVLVVFRNLQNLYELIYKRLKNKKLAFEMINTLLGYAKKNADKNSISILATLVFDCDASFDLYAHVAPCFACELNMIPSEEAGEDYEICDLAKSRIPNGIVSHKHNEYIRKQKDLAKKQGVYVAYKEVVGQINNTISNDEILK